MHQRSDELLFAAFQQHRDCEALTTLFRRRAEELLRLAVFLAPRPSEAEDLVQATFLSAIARAETYRTGHRVMSWLCGILTNHARMLRRAERRSQPERTTAEMFEDPVSAALRSELRHALAQSITALAEPYRSVLTLHLESGLNSSEISQRLDRPAATVRKQMERAIQQLRTALPIGLATGVLVRMNPAQIAQHAAEAAQFVDVSPLADAAGGGAADTLPAAGHHAARGGDNGMLAGSLLAAAALLATIALWWAATSTAAARAEPFDLATTAAAIAIQTPAATADPAATAAATIVEREPVILPTLTVTATAPDGTPHGGIELLCVADDGRAATARLSWGWLARATTDAAGRARFEALSPGRYDVTLAGSIVRRSIELHDAHHELALPLPASNRYAGRVTDPDGLPVAGAMVFVSETSGRGDLGHQLAVTGTDGSFAGSCLLPHGRVFARHPDYGQSVCERLESDRMLTLRLEEPTGSITVTACDEQGHALADCHLALVPRSQDTSFYAPFHGRTDRAGCCSFPDPGPREAAVIAHYEGLAPTAVEVPQNADSISITVPTSTTIEGIARTADGEPLADREVLASVAGSRTNEPTAPLLALHTRTDQHGAFRLDGLPHAQLQLRIVNQPPSRVGPPMSQFVVAGIDVDTSAGARHDVALTAHAHRCIEGVLRDRERRAVAGWYVLAVPELGSAAHRMFRRRVACTDERGRFRLEAVAPDESYQLGIYPPDRWWPNEVSWPVAFESARSGAPCELTVEASSRPAATLTCQAILPDGRAAADATFELRATAMHAPLTSKADGKGFGRFGELNAGDYWLVVVAPGLGSRTLSLHIDDDRHQLDLGSVQLQSPTSLAVRVLHRQRGGTDGLRVVGKNVLGDKFVSAVSDRRGIALLPPLPPGDSLLLLHGPGITPQLVPLELRPGQQWLDVTVEPARTVTLRFPFPLADNPFVLNGPLHVRIFDAREQLVLEDYVGATAVRGRFDLTTGLLPGRYHVVARSIWNAAADGDITVPEHGPPVVRELPLSL